MSKVTPTLNSETFLQGPLTKQSATTEVYEESSEDSDGAFVPKTSHSSHGEYAEEAPKTGKECTRAFSIASFAQLLDQENVKTTPQDFEEIKRQLREVDKKRKAAATVDDVNLHIS